jgi:hypothetical protein
MDRREFLKKAFQMGGVAALYNLGVTLEQAQAWGVMPVSVMEPSFGGDSWATWDEASEDTLTVDQDGDGTEDTNIWFCENTTAGGDETSRGILSGANLVISQDGNVAGATGDPPTRGIPVDDCFYAEDAYWHEVRDATKWQLIWKVNPTTNGNTRVVNYTFTDGAGGNNEFRVELEADNTLEVQAATSLAGDDFAATKTTNTVSTGTDLWIFVGWKSGTLYAAFKQGGGKPSAWADFAANDRMSGSFAGWDGTENFDQAGHNNCGIFGRQDNTSGLRGDAYYMVMSKAEPIALP